MRSLRLRHAALSLVVAVASLAAAAAPAAGDPIASKRAEARRVMDDIHRFDAKLGAMIERFNAANAELDAVREEVKLNTERLARAKRNLRAGQGQLAEIIIASYKGDTADDAANYILASGSFSDLVNRLEIVQRTEASRTQVVDSIRSSKEEIERRQAELRTAEQKAKELVDRRAAEKREVLATLEQRKRLLNSVNAEVERLIAERERRQEQAAAAAAAAAQAAESSSEPGSGGSGGGVVAPPPAGPLGSQAVAIAMRYLGVPYVWGGASPSGFDCSGLTMYAYAQVGISLPHYTGSQWNAGPHVPRDQLQPGDLVFFTPSLGHMGMYVGGGSFIHAPHTGDVVKISSLGDSWYASQYQGAVRVTG